MDLHNLPILTADSAIFLSAVFLFFIAVSVYLRLVRKSTAPSCVDGSVRLSFIGLAVLVIDSLPMTSSAHQVMEGILKLLVLCCLANLIIFLVIDVYVKYRTRSEVPSFVRELVTLVVYLVAAVTSLRVVFHIDLSSIVTTTTLLTATIAFAMQNTLTNVLSGFSIQSDRNMRQNAWISIRDKDVVGKIVNVGFRYTSLKGFDNSIQMVPNNVIMQNVVTSLGSDGDLAATSLDISLGYDLPPEKAKAILGSVFVGDNMICSEPPPQVRVLRFSESSIDYRLRYTLKDYASREVVKDRLHGKIWYALHRQGHGFPYPHREVITVSERRPPFASPTEGVQQELTRVDLFGALSDDEQRYLSQNARMKVFGPGESVVVEGEDGDSLFVVLRGKLTVLQGETPIASLAECDFFGEMSLLTGAPRRASVQASEEVWLLEVSKDVLEPLVQKNPAIMDTLSSVLAAREEVNSERRKACDQGREIATRKQEYLNLLREFFGL